MDYGEELESQTYVKYQEDPPKIYKMQMKVSTVQMIKKELGEYIDVNNYMRLNEIGQRNDDFGPSAIASQYRAFMFGQRVKLFV